MIAVVFELFPWFCVLSHISACFVLSCVRGFPWLKILFPGILLSTKIDQNGLLCLPVASFAQLWPRELTRDLSWAKDWTYFLMWPVYFCISAPVLSQWAEKCCLSSFLKMSSKEFGCIVLESRPICDALNEFQSRTFHVYRTHEACWRLWKPVWVQVLKENSHLSSHIYRSGIQEA